MGDVAELVLNGDVCEQCLEELGPGDGMPRRCHDCGGEYTEADARADRAAASQMRRASNRQNSANILHRAGVRFDMKNDGAHLIVKSNPITDFWPGTGKYIQRGTLKEGRGVFNLLKLIGVKAPKDEVK